MIEFQLNSPTIQDFLNDETIQENITYISKLKALKNSLPMAETDEMIEFDNRIGREIYRVSCENEARVQEILKGY